MLSPKNSAVTFLIIVCFSAGFLCAVLPAAAAESTASPVVVELFTSQGCSSCPPADRLLVGLNEIAEKHKLPVYCLSFHVDYWNSLGWRDPYSAKQFTTRQRQYAAAFKSNRVYTPQMIVNGETEFVGSRARDAQQAIQTALDKRTLTTIEMRSKIQKGKAIIDYRIAEHDDSMVLNVAIVQRGAANNVPHGENSGKSLAHVHVVRGFQSLSLTKSAGSTTLALPSGMTPEEVLVIGYAQDPRSMRISGAVRADFE